MPLIKERTIVEDNWVYLPDEEQTPSSGQVIVSLNRWQNEMQQLKNSSVMVGVSLSGSDSLTDIVSELDSIDLIALQFPAFTDGRCYSHAKLLKNRYKFNKEIRAVGNILFDQLAYMEQCGINSFEISSESFSDKWINAFDEFSEHYQTTNTAKESVFNKRISKPA